MLLYNFQIAIYNAITAATNVGIYDYIPEKTKLPYIVIGDDKVIEFNTKMEKGWEITTTIHVWGGERSMKNVKEQISIIAGALSCDLGEFEFKNITSMEAERIDVDLVKGTIIINYRNEVD